MLKKKYNVIIDTDPGVDDSAAIALSLYDDLLDIKLITTVNGNLDVDTVTRNALHVLEIFKRTDIPVVKGAKKGMFRVAQDAKFIHQESGMGNYIPSAVTTKPVKKDVVEAMYETIVKNKNDIYIIALGPHTNLGNLITKHPDVKDMISGIYCEGCAPYGKKSEGKKWVNYVSFNMSCDPEAVDIVLKSGIPLYIIPSRMGRELANFNESQVFAMREINDTGKFIFEMYSGYWEHGYTDRRIATNDTCAILLLRFPEIFKTKKCNIQIDCNEKPGKTNITFTKRGNVNYAYKVNRKKFHKIYFKAIEKMNDIKIF